MSPLRFLWTSTTHHARRSFHNTTSFARSPSLGPVVVKTALLSASTAGIYLWWNTGRSITVHADSDEADSKDESEQDKPTSLRPHYPPPGPFWGPEIIRNSAYTAFPASEHQNRGIARFDSVVVPSSHPCEDYLSSAFVHLPNSHNWSIFAIYDGRSGPYTSAWLADNIIPSVVGSLADLFSAQPELPKDPNTAVEPSPEHTALGGDAQTSAFVELGSELASPPHEDIDATLKAAFKRIDDDIVRFAVEQVLSPPAIPGTSLSPQGLPLTTGARAQFLLAPAYSEASVLFAMYDSASQVLRVARTDANPAPSSHPGRAGSASVGTGGVLGRRARDAQGELIRDKRGRIVYEMHSLAPRPKPSQARTIRVFGNGPAKWSFEDKKALHKSFLGDAPGPSPPSSPGSAPTYSAEPDICSVDIEAGDFLVLGSSGFWECMTGEEAVGLVSAWLQYPRFSIDSKVHPESGDLQRDIAHRPTQTILEASDLPVRSPPPHADILWNTGPRSDVDIASADKSPKAPGERLTPWRTKKRFALAAVDLDNASCHLARNALGGADTDLTGALLAMPPPRAAKFRQDVGVYVVFFREDLPAPSGRQPAVDSGVDLTLLDV
ncbi:hypothetical protein HGRIS_014479 [Hohenbuehelia grisea]|uniref:PPM-type phosphatase domain-containing protein n=1 Tax=Hohenbuehelia grisea TaxID=104357 RepID=A0ABR3JVI4_9AGAR